MRFTIKAKLGLSFSLLLVFIAVAGFFGISGLSSVNDRMKTFAEGPFVQVQVLGQIENVVLDSSRIIAVALSTQDDTGKAGRRKEFQTVAAKFDVLFKQYQALLPAEARSRSQPLVDDWNNYLAESSKAFDMTQINSVNQANDLTSRKGVEVIKTFDAALERFVQGRGITVGQGIDEASRRRQGSVR